MRSSSVTSPRFQLYAPSSGRRSDSVKNDDRKPKAKPKKSSPPAAEARVAHAKFKLARKAKKVVIVEAGRPRQPVKPQEPTSTTAPRPQSPPPTSGSNVPAPAPAPTYTTNTKTGSAVATDPTANKLSDLTVQLDKLSARFDKSIDLLNRLDDLSGQFFRRTVSRYQRSLN